jgi:sugar phosphate isomerase/epimerase
MKLSTTTAMYRFRPGNVYISIQDSIKKLHSAGYTDVDINFCKCNQMQIELTDDNWRQWAEDTRNLLESLGMTASQSHTPFYNVLDYDFPNREYTEEIVRRSIVASGILGVKAVTIHGGTHFGSSDFKKNKQDNIEYFKPHLELAAKSGTSIAIENLFNKRNVEWNKRTARYLTRAEELVDLVDTLGESYDNVGITWDFGHANEMGWNQVEALKLIGSRLISLHVNDNFGVLDDHLMPYHGEIEWEPLMKTLKEIGYKGVFAYETHKATERVPEGVIDSFLRYTYDLGNYLISLCD